MEVKVIKWDVDWKEIKNMARTTISLKDSNKRPTTEWIRKMLIAEHSVLRHSLITIEIEGIPYAMMGHLVRHSVGVTPYVSTSREDRTGIKREERSQMDLVNMRMDLNIQSLINISRKRLCHQADTLTRQIWEEVVYKVSEYDEDVAWACVPEGIRTCGCPEGFGECRCCNNIIQGMDFDSRLYIPNRYDRYDKLVKKRKKPLKKQ